MVYTLVKKNRLRDLLRMFLTMRCDACIFENCLWRLCSSVNYSPDEVFPRVVNQVIKPIANSGRFYKFINFPRLLNGRTFDNELTCKTLADVLIRYFGYDFYQFRHLKYETYSWICARFFAFDAKTPETFLALSPQLRQRIRCLLILFRRLPRDVRNRLARTLVMQEFLKDSQIDIVTDTGTEITNERDEYRILLLKHDYVAILNKMGLPPDTNRLTTDLSVMAMYLGRFEPEKGHLLRLHETVQDEACLPIKLVMEWQRELGCITLAQEDYIISHLLKTGTKIHCGSYVFSTAREAFQARLLRLERCTLTVPPSYHSIIRSRWRDFWDHWTPSKLSNQELTSISFQREAFQILLCCRGNKQIAFPIIRALAKLHGHAFDTQTLLSEPFRFKSNIIRYAICHHFPSLEPCLTREELYTFQCTKMDRQNDTKRRRVACDCQHCAASKCSLINLQKALCDTKALVECLRSIDRFTF